MITNQFGLDDQPKALEAFLGGKCLETR